MKHKKLIVAIILIALLAVYFYKVVFLGRALSSTDNLYMYPPFNSYAPTGFEHSINTLLADQTGQFYPFLFFARENIRNGHVPLWNPYIMMGMPFIADAQSAVFYPVNLVFYTLPFKDAFAISAFIRLFIAGFGMFLFADAIGIEFLGALFVGISFMFCAFNIVWLNHPFANVSVFLPWLFLLSYKFIKTGRLRYTGWLALVTGIQFLGGHPETSAHVLLATMIYILTLLAFQYKDKRPLSEVIKKFALITISLILGFMIASPMLLPFLSELLKSATWELRSKPNTFFLSLKALPAFIAPQFYGSPIYNNYWGPSNFNEQSGYVGIAVLMLAVIAVVYRRYRNRDVLFFCFLALGFMLIVFGIPPFFQIFTALPFFSHMANNELILIYQFSIIMLAGIGIDIIQKNMGKEVLVVKDKIKDKKTGSTKKEQEQQTIRLKRLEFISLITGTMIFLIETCFILYWLANGSLGHFDTIFYRSIIISIAFIGLFLAIIYWIQPVYNVKKAIVAIIGLQFIDLFVFGYNYNPQIKKDWIFPDVPILSELKNNLDDYRFTSLGPSYLPDTLMVYGITDVRGYDFPVNKRYNNFFTTFISEAYLNSYLIMKINPENARDFVKYLELCGVRYIYDIRDGKIYQLPDPKRAYLAHKTMLANTPEDALGLVKVYIDDLLKDSVVLEEKRDINIPECTDTTQDAVQIVSYEPDRVSMLTATKCPAILVLTDTYDDGWKAYMDGKEVPILHANYLFRGIALEPGVHRVEFAYKPFSFKLGTILCAIALISVVIALFR